MTSAGDAAGRSSATAGLSETVHRMAGVTVVCAGDVMLDRFVYGAVSRISPEAPIPVLAEHSEARMLGGAGNVARNLAALGVRTRFVAAVGDDAEGRDVANLLEAEAEIAADLVIVSGRATTRKTRYVAGVQQLLRADREDVSALPAAACDALVERFERALVGADAAVLSDYAKGTLASGVTQRLIAAARAAGIPVIVDPKGMDFGAYRGADVITPNRQELAFASGMPVDGDECLVAASRAVLGTSGAGVILVTRSAEGMTLVSAAEALHVPAQAREVFDVSGAGDTVAAVLAAARAAGAGLPEAVVVANAAAGVVVGKLGTAVAHPAEILAALSGRVFAEAAGKRATAEEAARRVARWRAEGLTVGFTNGCFDLLHPGHIHLLASARAGCDRLIVGLNDDASVGRLKGAGRPVQTEDARAMVLGALAGVDLVVLFDEDTPLHLIEAVSPDVLFKGADYHREEVVGGDFVEARGGRVVLIPLAPGHSTTATIARMAR